MLDIPQTCRWQLCRLKKSITHYTQINPHNCCADWNTQKHTNQSAQHTHKSIGTTHTQINRHNAHTNQLAQRTPKSIGTTVVPIETHVVLIPKSIGTTIVPIDLCVNRVFNRYNCCADWFGCCVDWFGDSGALAHETKRPRVGLLILLPCATKLRGQSLAC